MHRVIPGLALAAAVILVTPAGTARAQIVASERGTVSQTIDGTLISVDYARPSLRGRTHIFDTEVPRNLLWTPGADDATKISISRDVTIEGTPVPAGSYSLWMVTSRGDWQVVLDPDTTRFHLPHPDPALGQIAFTVRADTTAPFAETLMFSFPAVRATGADLRMHWENTLVEMTVGVQPTRDLTISAADAAPYVGRWDVEERDAESGDLRTFSFELEYVSPHLATVIEIFPGYPFETYFAPASPQVFNPVYVMNGTVAGVWEFVYFEFELGEDGRAESFAARAARDDTIWMTGKRVDPP